MHKIAQLNTQQEGNCSIGFLKRGGIEAKGTLPEPVEEIRVECRGIQEGQSGSEGQG